MRPQNAQRTITQAFMPKGQKIEIFKKMIIYFKLDTQGRQVEPSRGMQIQVTQSGNPLFPGA